eukprot:scaffold439816_cov35-Prasinocladus_malaysianus.AAC.2
MADFKLSWAYLALLGGLVNLVHRVGKPEVGNRNAGDGQQRLRPLRKIEALFVIRVISDCGLP